MYFLKQISVLLLYFYEVGGMMNLLVQYRVFSNMYRGSVRGVNIEIVKNYSNFDSCFELAPCRGKVLI